MVSSVPDPSSSSVSDSGESTPTSDTPESPVPDYPLVRPTRTTDAIVLLQLDTSVIQQDDDVWGDDLMVALDRCIQEWRGPESGDPPAIYSQAFMVKWGEVVAQYELLFGPVQPAPVAPGVTPETYVQPMPPPPKRVQ
jgi:hypothetical protein